MARMYTHGEERVRERKRERDSVRDESGVHFYNSSQAAEFEAINGLGLLLLDLGLGRLSSMRPIHPLSRR
jgi:hypothetical protein